jgi:hypothetical protein
LPDTRITLPAGLAQQREVALRLSMAMRVKDGTRTETQDLRSYWRLKRIKHGSSAAM